MAKEPAGKKPAPRKTVAPKPAAPVKRVAGEAVLKLRADIAAARAAGYLFYVYTLSDMEGVFYIGKGTKHRLFDHERLSACDRNAVKQARIRVGGEPVKAILAFFKDEAAALAFEAGCIEESRDTLTNIAGGAITTDQVVRARAQELLDGMLSFDDWAPRLSPMGMVSCARVAGSVRAFYDRLRAAAEQVVANPSGRYFVPTVKYPGVEYLHD
jgi:hypothetical protein